MEGLASWSTRPPAHEAQTEEPLWMAALPAVQGKHMVCAGLEAYLATGHLRREGLQGITRLSF